MLSVILPAYKERENLSVLLPELAKMLGAGGYEIIVVDDNSGDGTEKLLSQLSRDNPAIRLLKRKGKMGLASAVIDGVAASRGNELLVMDADLSHPPARVPALRAALRDADLVICSRNLPGGGVEDWPLHRKMVSWGATLLSRILLGTRTTDPMSGFFAARRGVFMNTRLRVKGYKILLNVLADNPGIRVAEVPYVFRDRLAGETKLGPGEFGQYLLDLLRLRFGSPGNPLGRGKEAAQPGVP